MGKEQERTRIIVLIDDHTHVEFFGADDFEVSGEVLTEIRVRSDGGEVMCRYPDDVVPERYTAFSTVGLKTRVNAKGVRNAWAVVANISEHRTIIALATLRRIERKR